MGSPLTLTMANCFMFFFERDMAKQIHNGGGLYVRYIDDIFITINWPARHLLKQIERWNQFDINIQLSATVNSKADFLDLHIENRNGELQTTVFHKPSYEPYYLPFNSIHQRHMKKNIPFAMLIRAFLYCSSFQTYIDERESLRMALLLNRYPSQFITEQFNRVLLKFNINGPVSLSNYETIRKQIIDTPSKEKATIEYDTQLFVHFTYCSSMRSFPRQFHMLWERYFGESPINGVTPILGTRNVNNLQQQLVRTK